MPRPRIPPLTRQELTLLADALDSHLAMLDVDEEWAEDRAATKKLAAKIEQMKKSAPSD